MIAMGIPLYGTHRLKDNRMTEFITILWLGSPTDLA